MTKDEWDALLQEILDKLEEHLKNGHEIEIRDVEYPIYMPIWTTIQMPSPYGSIDRTGIAKWEAKP